MTSDMSDARREASRVQPPVVSFRVAAIAVVLLFCLLGLPSAMLSPSVQNIWWPPAALQFVGVLVYGWRFAPVVLAARLLDDVLIWAVFGHRYGWGEWAGIGAAAVVAIAGYTAVAEGVRRLGADWRLSRLRDVQFVVGGSVIGSQCVAWAATGLLASLTTSGYWHRQPWADSALQWWTADQVSLLGLAPVMLVALRPRGPRDRGPALQWLWLAAIPPVLWVAFASPWAASHHILYLCFLPLIWAALAGGLASAAIATALLNVGIMIAVTLCGLRAYSSADMQILMSVMALTGLVLGAVVSDLRAENRVRQAAEASLEQLNADLERRVAERTAQLEAANRELEAFSYSVSHDLRAPLRAIAGFSQAVLEDYAARLDQEGREFLQFIRQGAQRMDTLIEDLLRLSRVGRAEMRVERVNLSALVHEIAHELRQQNPDRQVEWQIPPDVTVVGDMALLRIMLVNLLGNAWKFTGRCPVARIELLVTRQADETVYGVRDNGAGFNMAYAGKLFKSFQRLHGAEEFPGTGIGLAIVQRIIHRHGGRVWAEGAPGQGATFYFTLPRGD